MTIQDEINMRREEVASYQQNINTFTVLSQTLPSEWPARLEQYKNRTDRHQAAGEIEDMSDVELLSDLWFHDDCLRRIRSETVELRKVQAILSVLEAQNSQ